MRNLVGLSRLLYVSEGTAFTAICYAAFEDVSFQDLEEGEGAIFLVFRLWEGNSVFLRWRRNLPLV